MSAGTAAIVGAAVGGAIAILGQAMFIVFGALRARRVAAQIIYAELIGNIANALVALSGGGWSSTKPAALRSAWDSYAARLLLPWHRAHDVGAVAVAYNRVDDIAWLATEDAIRPSQDYSQHILDLYTGLYVVGRTAKYTDAELAARQVPIERVKERLSQARAAAETSRRPGA